MLILSRKPGESIVIDGRIVVTIVRLEGEMVKVGIEAAREVPVVVAQGPCAAPSLGYPVATARTASSRRPLAIPLMRLAPAPSNPRFVPPLLPRCVAATARPISMIASAKIPPSPNCRTGHAQRAQAEAAVSRTENTNRILCELSSSNGGGRWVAPVPFLAVNSCAHY